LWTLAFQLKGTMSPMGRTSPSWSPLALYLKRMLEPIEMNEPSLPVADHRRPSTVVGICVVAALIGVIACFGLVSINWAKRAAAESSCNGHVTKIALALGEYRLAHGRWPPAIVRDRNGRAMHSWRVLILPELGYHELHQKYDFDEPWNSGNNLQLLANRPTVYGCPNCQGGTTTSYFLLASAAQRVLVVPDSIPGDAGRVPGSQKRMMEVVVCEHNNTRVRWTEPQEPIYIETPKLLATSDGCDPHGTAVGTIDGGCYRGVELELATTVGKPAVSKQKTTSKINARLRP